MHEDNGLMDVRGEDLAGLLSPGRIPAMATALDRVLSSGSSSNGFNDYIDGNNFNNSIG